MQKDLLVLKNELLKIISKMNDTFTKAVARIDEEIAYIVANMVTKGELVEELQNLEERMDDRFVLLEGRLGHRFDAMEARFNIYDERYDHIMNSVDKLLVPLATLREEYVMSVVQYSRQVEWNHKVAKKVGIPFDY